MDESLLERGLCMLNQLLYMGDQLMCEGEEVLGIPEDWPGAWPIPLMPPENSYDDPGQLVGSVIASYGRKYQSGDEGLEIVPMLYGYRVTRFEQINAYETVLFLRYLFYCKLNEYEKIGEDANSDRRNINFQTINGWFKRARLGERIMIPSQDSSFAWIYLGQFAQQQPTNLEVY